MASKVLIDIMDENNHDAGTKARNDVTTVLNEMGFQTTVLFNRTHNNIRRTMEVLRALKEIGNDITKNDLIVLQYPYQPRIMQLIIKRISKIRKKTLCKFVILLHDVVYLRNESSVSQNLIDIKKMEVEFFNSADYIIVHNEVMMRELESAGVNSNMLSLELFDYVYNGNLAITPNNCKPTIVFAGNLSPAKSGFIYSYKDNESVLFNLYGSTPQNIPDCFNYKGSFPPDELIESLEGDFGLVWDGPSSDSCQGNYGKYLRYNNPHKASLYIAAGLPIIVWEESALKSFVVKHNIGFSISSLSELANTTTIDSNSYQIMYNNVLELGKKLRTGYMLKEVIKKVRNDINGL